MGHMGPGAFEHIIRTDPTGEKAEQVRRTLPGLHAKVLAQIAEEGTGVDLTEQTLPQSPDRE